MKRGNLLILSGVVAVSACVGGCVAVPRLKSATAPWVPPAAATRPDPEWQALRGQKVDLSRPLSLAELADLALRNNPATARAWSDARAAAAQVEMAQGYFIPSVTASAAGTRQYVKATPDSFDQSFQKISLGAQMNYLVINFGGGRSAAVEQALQTVYAADFAFNRAIQDVLLAAATTYYGLISAQAGVVAAEAGVKDTGASLEAARERAKQKVGTQVDVLQAQAAYDRAVYNLAGARGALRSAQAGIAQAAGLPADTAIQVAPPAVEVPAAPEVKDMGLLIDAALRRRPDIAALRSTLSAREAAVKVAGAPLWPSLYLNASAGRDLYDTLEGKALQDDDWVYGGGVSLQWTVFDGFITANAKRAARAQADSVRAQLRQAELAASADVWTRYHSYETAVEKFKASVAYLASTSRLRELAMESYRNGLLSILDLVTAEDQLAQARSQQIAARQDVFIALANLAASTGALEKEEMIRTQGGASGPAGKDNKP